MNGEKNLFWKINKAESQDPGEMNVLEQKHTPVLTAPDKVPKRESFKVTVEVGKYHDHPNEHKHFIQWIELYLDENLLGEAYFHSEKGEPVVTFNVKIPHSGELRAREHCNLHGTWESFGQKIEVKE